LQSAAVREVDCAVTVEVLSDVGRPVGVGVPTRESIDTGGARLTCWTDRPLWAGIPRWTLRTGCPRGSRQTDGTARADRAAGSGWSLRSGRTYWSRWSWRSDERTVLDVPQDAFEHGAELIDTVVQARLTARDLLFDHVHGTAQQLCGLVAGEELVPV
jgi:hypothetical protein